MNRIFDKKKSWSNKERKVRQDESLARMVKLGYKKSARLKAILDENKINPKNIKTREDLEKLPVTSREKLVDMEIQEPPYAGWKIPRYQLTAFLLHRDRFMNRIFPRMIICGQEHFLPRELVPRT